MKYLPLSNEIGRDLEWNRSHIEWKCISFICGSWADFSMAAAIITLMQLATTSREGSSPGLIIACVCLHSWVVVFVRAHLSLFMGSHICSWGWHLFEGVCVHLWAVVTLVRCGCGPLVGGGGVAPHGHSWGWQGGVARCCEWIWWWWEGRSGVAMFEPCLLHLGWQVPRVGCIYLLFYM